MSSLPTNGRNSEDFGFATKLNSRKEKLVIHFYVLFLPATQASVSHTTTAGKYVFIVPKPTDNNSTGSPASAVPQETPLHSQPAREQMGNRFLQSDGTDKQDARETGFEALSALGRLSAKIGMEENLVDQSLSA